MHETHFLPLHISSNIVQVYKPVTEFVDTGVFTTAIGVNKCQYGLSFRNFSISFRVVYFHHLVTDAGQAANFLLI